LNKNLKDIFSEITIIKINIE